MNEFEQFRDAIRSAGLEPPPVIYPDGKLRRFASNGKRGDDAGWYVLSRRWLSPLARSATGGRALAKHGEPTLAATLTPAEEAEHRAKVEAMRREREAEEAKRHAAARAKAASIWQVAQPAPPDHAYLTRKGIKAHGARLHNGALVIPMRNESGVIHSLQFIAPDGDKQFLKNGQVSGCYYSIGKLDTEQPLCIAEGFATGATIHEAAGYAVAVAMNAGNLQPVAQALRAKFPELVLILCADDDAATDRQSRTDEGHSGGFGCRRQTGYSRLRRGATSGRNRLQRHGGALRRRSRGACNRGGDVSRKQSRNRMAGTAADSGERDAGTVSARCATTNN